MKLEVGKKYVGEGGVYEYVGKSSRGEYYFDAINGFGGLSTSTPHIDIKEHVEPRTKDVWVVWTERYENVTVCKSKDGLARFLNARNDENVVRSVKKITLVEGEYDEN